MLGTAVVAVLVLVSAGLRAVQGQVTGPTDPVEALLSQLADGDTTAVTDHTDVMPLPFNRQGLAEGYTPPEDLRTTDVTYAQDDPDTQRPNREAATVGIAYRIGDTDHTAYVYVQRESTGWIRSWEIMDLGTLLGELVVTSSHLDHVVVAGATVQTTNADTTAGLPALPGTYTLTTPDEEGEEELFTAGISLGEVTVLGPDTTARTEAAIDPADLQIRDGLLDEVTEQVTDFLEECVTAADAADTLSPADCPMRVDRSVYRTAREVTWTLTEQPDIALVPATEAGLHGAPLEVETTTPGTAEVTWTYAYTDDEDPEETTVDITAAGTVRLDPDGTALWRP
ncbi:hypothetical protein HNR06_004882 [Nocardiopsis arvandica]|uniref:Uncharacterized protein n=1 Tax=Nocardiopsis sinuspersici TaxID=501010 RepID=A0A7Z0BKX9_9ACTN|nr:hypothetical protein [Nocardiopsis sinuspersici]